MKLATQPVDIEKSADFTSIMMGIGNEVMIMEFLRNNLYSNKIGIVVQEYMSNARDAHREAGIPERPIEVTIPTKLEPNFKVRDYGPGIDHERMESAFAQYGVSTKNQSDSETGGFGIGCMSGFSYTDTFTVIVVLADRKLPEFLEFYIEDSGIDMDILIEEDLVPTNRTKRQYVCYIDETRAGSIDLVDTDETDDKVGTTIIVPCKKGDMYEFKSQAVRVTEWWDHVPSSTRPIINGVRPFEWPEPNIVYSNDDARWMILKKKNHYDNSPEDDPFVILDGIPYPLNLASIYPRRDMEEKSEMIFDVNDEEEEKSPIPDFAKSLFSVPLRMVFDTGELTVAVSREALDYSSVTREALRDRISSIHKSICNIIDKRIKNVANLWEACVQWRKINHEFAFIEVAAEWEEKRLFTEMEIPTRTKYGYAKECTAVYIYRWDYEMEDFSMSKAPSSNWHDEKIIPSLDIILVEDDTDFTRPPKSKMRTIMNDIPKDKRSDAIVKVVKFRKTADRALVEDKYNWSALNPIMLSEVEKTLKVRPKTAPPKQVKVRIIGDGHRNFHNTDDVDFKDGKGIYVAQYKGRFITDPENFRPNKDYNKCIVLNEEQLHRYCIRWNIKIYAILERFVKKLGSGWGTFADFAKKKLKKDAAKPNIAPLFNLDPSKNADHMQYHGLNVFWENYDVTNKVTNKWLDRLNDPLLKEYMDITARYWKHSSEIDYLRRQFKLWNISLEDRKDLKETFDILEDRYGNALKHIKPCPTSFTYKERNRKKELVAEYYTFFTKYLNLIELEKRLGVKS